MAPNLLSVEDLLRLPYDQRRLITVTDEDLDITSASGEIAIKPLNTMLALLLAFDPLLAVTAAAIRAGVAFFSKKKSPDKPVGNPSSSRIVAVKPSLAEQLEFPKGHPRDRIVYSVHPAAAVARRYYPLAQFHRDMFEDKLLEAWRVLVCLKAAEVEIVQIEESSRNMGGKVGVGVPTGMSPVELAVSANAGTTSYREGHLYATFDVSGPPEDPDQYGFLWYPQERAWREVAHYRLHSGLKKFSLEFRYADDFGVNASLAAKVADIGLDVGGSFCEMNSTRWLFKGAFA